MSTKSLAAQRIRLWEADPHCHYCGVLTIYKPQHIKGLYTPQEQNFLATIDHVRPRHHPDRLRPPRPGETLHVLACWKCNNDRDKRELAEKPKEWFEQNGGSIPLAKRPIEELVCIMEKLRWRDRRDGLPYPDPLKMQRRPGRNLRESWNKFKRSQVAIIWALWERGWKGEDNA